MPPAAIPVGTAVVATQSAAGQTLNLKARAETVIREARLEFPAWRNAVVVEPPVALYRPDVEGPAYYEFAVVDNVANTPAGFIVVSTGAHDLPVVEWSTSGKANYQELADAAASQGKKAARYYVLDAVSFVAEDSEGNAAAIAGEAPQMLSATEWRDFKRQYSTLYKDQITALREQAAQRTQPTPTVTGDQAVPTAAAGCGAWQYHWAGTDQTDAVNSQRWYLQMPPGSPPNDSECYSGCGATAWAMLFGWADYRASINDPAWGRSWGFFGDITTVAPNGMTKEVKDMIWEIRGQIATDCVAGQQGRTWPWDMDGARAYLESRPNSAPYLLVRHGTDLKDDADQVLRSGTPVVILLGVEHYPLAFGYRKRICSGAADDHEFFINDGYGKWRATSAGTYFIGTIIPFAPQAEHCIRVGDFNGDGMPETWLIRPCPAD